MREELLRTAEPSRTEDDEVEEPPNGLATRAPELREEDPPAAEDALLLEEELLEEDPLAEEELLDEDPLVAEDPLLLEEELLEVVVPLLLDEPVPRFWFWLPAL